ncbi:hypothetical protein TNCV_4495461 [Trichonephila clavipes]|nr:hypothetical protein TNCV_4495461 [Trichonephila clavipes]
MACRSTRLTPCTPAAFGKLSSPTNLHQISTGDPASLFHSKVSLLLDSHFPSGSSSIPLVFNDCSPPSCLSPSEVEVVFRKLRGVKPRVQSPSLSKLPVWVAWRRQPLRIPLPLHF